ncbi:hypothetical protein JTE90_024811 [Oedothorax gibbosus]|uniref:Pyridoxal phosphate homeostasis protein n=1 Tax=Oedothorax gibbosus TaxID=931172 RepID=A0AAV6UP07_9ARAC|nr:hypothetical protein JTE90_024811 [Oedothorax gibbosus]
MPEVMEVMDPSSQTIIERLNAIKEEIKQSLSDKRKQDEDEICVVAVSKIKPKSMIIEAYQNGVRDFGENYVNEIIEKSNDPEVLEMCPDIKWHFIGHLQSNKTAKLLNCPNLYMLHTLDSIKLAEIVQKEMIKVGKSEPLKVMIQVNTSNETNKSGIKEGEVDSLAKYIIENCSRLELCGFMTIGAPDYNTELGPNPEYQMLINIRDRVSSLYDVNNLKLSMGMSKDFIHAVQLGSSYVRIGERIFGPRQKNQK